MSCVRIFNQNYVTLDILANSDVSSEQAAFPVENAYAMNRRSKVWRSNGYWQIVSGENTIVFTEGGGDLTATVAAGTYTSTASLLTALDAAFTNAPGASGSYTVTLSSALKIVVTKSAGTFTIKWTHANSADMAAVLGFSTAVDDTGSLAYTADILKINTEESIIWDMGIATNPQAFILIGPRNRALKFSPSSVIKLQGNETNVWTTPAYETTLTIDDEVVQVLSDAGLHTTGLRYWRVQFLDQSNPLGYIEVGAFFLGDYYSPTRGKAQFPYVERHVDRTREVDSEGGQTFSDLLQKTQSFDLTWLGLLKGEQQEFREIFEQFGTGVPFFMSFDAEAKFSTSVPRRIKYVKFRDEPGYQLVSPNNFNCTMNLIEQL